MESYTRNNAPYDYISVSDGESALFFTTLLSHPIALLHIFRLSGPETTVLLSMNHGFSTPAENNADNIDETMFP